MTNVVRFALLVIAGILVALAQPAPASACLQPGWDSSDCVDFYTEMYIDCHEDYSGSGLDTCIRNASIFLDNCSDSCNPH